VYWYSEEHSITHAHTQVLVLLSYGKFGLFRLDLARKKLTKG